MITTPFLFPRSLPFGLLVIATLAIAAEAATVAGTVYLDANADGIRQADEAGLPGVRVSNGEAVTVTDGDGRYTLNLDGNAIVFITKPAGYATPVDDRQIPRFYYIHQPKGSPPGLRYRGLDPTGPLPESVDFPLQDREEPVQFEAILLADPQPQSDRELDYVRDDIISELIGTQAQFGMTLGDIMFDDLALFPRYNALIAAIGIPWYNVPGNHELNFFAESDAYSLETFKRHFGPPYYSFEYGDALFIVLDNIVYEGAGTAKPHDDRRRGKYRAALSERQLTWLENELAFVPQEKLIVIAMHAPLGTELGEAEGRITAGREKLFELLSGRSKLYAVAGHTHTTEHMYFDESHGFKGPGKFHHHVLATGSGAWWSGPADERGIPSALQRDGVPNGYHRLFVNGDEVSLRYKAAGHAADYQMRIVFRAHHHDTNGRVVRHNPPGSLFAGRLRQAQLDGASMLVNLFDGGPKSTVDARIGDREPFELTREPGIDPVAAEHFERHREVVKEWVQATPTPHLFRASLPADLRRGTHTVSVRATDEFGQVHHGHAVLEIE